MTADSTDTRPAEDADEAQRQADQAALERLYGPRKADSKTQWGVGVALLLLGPALFAMSAAMDGEPALIAVGVVAVGVGLWSIIDGLVRSKRTGKDSSSS